MNPLVTVLMGVFILGERLRRWQWAALAVGALAVVVLTLDYGRPPWIALTLALTFGSYGLCKKQANAPAIESLTFETMVIGPVALAYLGWLAWHGESNFADHGAGHMLLLMSAGIVTAVPLVCFGGAAIRVPLVTLGLLQYLTPTLQFAARRPLLPRGHAGRALGRLRPGLGGPGDPHRRVAASSAHVGTAGVCPGRARGVTRSLY